MLVRITDGHFINPKLVEQFTHTENRNSPWQEVEIKMGSGVVIELTLEDADIRRIKNSINQYI